MDTTTKRERLSLYAHRFDTDKLSHGYMKHYASELPDKCGSMLEIGVAKGASAQTWEAFYGKDNLDLYLLDLYGNPEHVSPRWVRNQGWVPIIGDQSDIEVLKKIDRQFNVIIDDGSHNAHHQLISFKHLFVNNLVSGGVYVIEDLHCNQDPFYYGDLVTRLEQTPIWMLSHFGNWKEIKNPYFNPGESRTFESLIKSVNIYDDKIAFITKK